MSHDKDLFHFYRMAQKHNWNHLIVTRDNFEFHYNVKLSDEQWEQITGTKNWNDCFGSYVFDAMIDFIEDTVKEAGLDV